MAVTYTEDAGENLFHCFSAFWGGNKLSDRPLCNVPFKNPRSPSPFSLSGSQSPATEQPDFINNPQNARIYQELFLLISLLMDNHNGIRFRHLTHGEDTVAGAPPQARRAARPVPCVPDGADQCNARCTYCSCKYSTGVDNQKRESCSGTF